MAVDLSLDFPFAYQRPSAAASFRVQPEDFCVTELYEGEFTGAGEHLCLWIEKTGHNTRWVAKLLAEAMGVTEQCVGYCGLKDRRAVTGQWFSVHLPGSAVQAADIRLAEGIEIGAMVRHRSKLRRGDHQGNHFRIRLRNVVDPQHSLPDRLRIVAEQGVPNYYGEQRFGRDGKNLLAADSLLNKRAQNPRRRSKGSRDGLYLSAARSYLFNRVLAARVAQDCWNRPLGQEPYPEGPLWGRGRNPATPEVAQLEQQVLAPFATWQLGLELSGLTQQRRPLVLKPQAFNWQWEASDLLLDFTLPNGTFATSLLRELMDLRTPESVPVL